ncbi:MAG: hypothetical protein H9W81_13625 [Enterococcus sp.]|nr:hypothetical protein [Enterococcus sp.]
MSFSGTTLFLDFDNVVSSDALFPPRDSTGWLGDWTRITLDGMEIMFSHELIEEITLLSARENLNIVWLTDWAEGTKDISRVTGLPVFPFLEMQDDDLYTVDPWWKLRHVQREWETTNNRIIWLDDSIPGNTQAQEWVEREQGRALAIAPVNNWGLTRHHLQQVYDFLDN